MASCFDPTHGADAQILRLPMELIEMIAKDDDLSFGDLKSFRAAHRQFTAYLDDLFSAQLTIHVVVDHAYLHDFEQLANSTYAANVKNLKLANRYLCDTYKHIHTNACDRTPRTTHHGVSCVVAKLFSCSLVPDSTIIRRFASLLAKFENLISISTYNVMCQATYETGSRNERTAQLTVAHERLGYRAVQYACTSDCAKLSRAEPEEQCYSRGFCWPGSTLLYELACTNNQVQLPMLKSLSLDISCYAPLDSMNGSVTSLAKFVKKCPELEHLRIELGSTGDIHSPSLELDEFFDELVIDPKTCPSKLITFDIRSFTPDLDSSVRLNSETNLISQNKDTLRVYRNNRAWQCYKSGLKAYLSALLACHKLEKMDLTRLNAGWRPLSTTRVQQLLCGILYNFQQWRNVMHYGIRGQHEEPLTLQHNEVQALQRIRQSIPVEKWSVIMDSVCSGGKHFDDLKAQTVAKEYERKQEDSLMFGDTFDFGVTRMIAPYELRAPSSSWIIDGDNFAVVEKAMAAEVGKDNDDSPVVSDNLSESNES